MTATADLRRHADPPLQSEDAMSSRASNSKSLRWHADLRPMNPAISVVVLDAEREQGQVIARHCAGLGWPVALHYRESTPCLETLIVDIWDAGGVVQAFPQVIADPLAVD